MRVTYQEQLDDFTHDLIILGDGVRGIMAAACDGLLRGSLDSVEQALAIGEGLSEIRVRCAQRAVDLFALCSPMGRNLRQVVSSIYILEHLDRMAVLATHIAQSAHRRHPEHVIPVALAGYFEELTRLSLGMVNKARDLLLAPDAEAALALARDDDAVDDLAQHLVVMLTQREWPHTLRETVDTALLVRFYERFADQCVNVGTRIVYLVTGLPPEDYLTAREPDVAGTDLRDRFDVLERQFHRD